MWEGGSRCQGAVLCGREGVAAAESPCVHGALQTIACLGERQAAVTRMRHASVTPLWAYLVCSCLVRFHEHEMHVSLPIVHEMSGGMKDNC